MGGGVQAISPRPTKNVPSRGTTAADPQNTRRQQVLDAAARLFANRGYHGTRIDDVASAVGMNKATVYHYYASKSLLLYDIYRQAADFTLSAVHDHTSGSAREAIYCFTTRLLTGIAGDIDRAAVYFQESPYITEWLAEEQVTHIQAAETAVYEHLRTLIDDGLASGEFIACDSHVLALGYIGMTTGSYRWLREQPARSPAHVAAELSSALLRGLVRDEQGRRSFD